MPIHLLDSFGVAKGVIYRLERLFISFFGMTLIVPSIIIGFLGSPLVIQHLTSEGVLGLHSLANTVLASV